MLDWEGGEVAWCNTWLFSASSLTILISTNSHSVEVVTNMGLSGGLGNGVGHGEYLINAAIFFF